MCTNHRELMGVNKTTSLRPKQRQQSAICIPQAAIKMMPSTTTKTTTMTRRLSSSEKQLGSFVAIVGAILVAQTTTANALKVAVSIPDLVKLNDAFWLNCSHQTSKSIAPENYLGSSSAARPTSEIYAIKWYKDEEEFYRFLPNAEPKVSIYETNGIQLDVSTT